VGLDFFVVNLWHLTHSEIIVNVKLHFKPNHRVACNSFDGGINNILRMLTYAVKF